MGQKILCAPDKFKGSLSAKRFTTIAQQVFGTECHPLPLADGGEGSLAALASIGRWDQVFCTVTGPEFQSLRAHYLFEPVSKTACIEMALASGLSLVPPFHRNPRFTTTLGTGELVWQAWLRGAQTIYVFAGGSATHDAGIGLLAGCGYRWLDRNDYSLAPRGAALECITAIQPPDSLPPHPQIRIATDVRNPLTGPEGAACQYAPQKGGSEDDIRRLEDATRQFYHWVCSQFNRTFDAPGLGAAGGLALCPVAWWDAEILPATNLLFDLLQVEEKIAATDVVVTGEGKLDKTSLQGKLVAAICHTARKYQKEVWGVFGQVTLSPQELSQLGITRWITLSDLAGSAETAMRQADRWLPIALNRLKSGQVFQ